MRVGAGKVQGRRSIISRHKIDGEIKNGIGNRELKKLICTTHGHELWMEECWSGGAGWSRDKGDKTLGKR